jgi:hypothetical protein
MTDTLVQAFAELTLEGNVVQIWDFFHRDAGRGVGAAALGDGNHSPNPSH